MSLLLRRGIPDDANRCGGICYEAFKVLGERHGFPLDHPSPDISIKLMNRLLAHPGIYGVVAELDGRIVGSNFLDERSPIAGVGPITVDPMCQDNSVGRKLMVDVLDRARESGFAGVRLVQAAYHNRSLSLYSKLGFDVREPLVTLQGPVLGLKVSGYSVRAASESDLDACDDLCRRIHGHDRRGELKDGIKLGTAVVVEHAGRISGYASAMGFMGHAVGESNEDLKAMIGAAPEFLGPGFLLPARNGEMFRWCLTNGLRVIQVMTLMSLGLYSEPRGAWLPSVMF